MRVFVSLVVTMVVLSGCIASDPDGDPDRHTDRDTEATTGESIAPVRSDVTFETLGIDSWDDPSGEVDFGDLPKVPEGLSESEWSALGETLEQWATRAALEPGELPKRFKPLAAQVLAGLPEAARNDLTSKLRRSTAPRLGIANIVGAPVRGMRVTSAWRSIQIDDGGPVRVLELQTRVAYEVAGDEGVEVIGVVRNQGLAVRIGADHSPGTRASWQEFGAADCALALDDILRPNLDVESERQDLEAFVEYGNDPAFVTPALDPDEVVDEEFLADCRSSQV